MKPVLYLSYDGMTDPLGQSQVLPYLRGLSKNGYKIHLISCEKPDRLAQHGETIASFCSEAEIDWHPIHYTKRPPLFSTIWDLRKITKKAKSLHRKHAFQLVHCRSYISAIVGLQLKHSYGIKFLFDMRGFWADERVEGNIWRLSNPVFKWAYQFFKKKEKAFFTEADHVISLTENGKQEILSWKLPFVDSNKITVIPCCVDVQLFNPENVLRLDQELLKTRIGLTETDFVLGYVGSIGTWYMLPEMLDYFKVLQTKKSNAKFLFVTGEHPETIVSAAAEKGIDRSAIVVVSCLHKEVPLYISLFDQSIFFIRPTYSKKASSPTKQGEIMALGIPLICNAGVGDTDRIVQTYQAGTVIEHVNELAYLSAITNGLAYNREATMLGAHEYFGLDSGVSKYTAIYRQLLT